MEYAQRIGIETCPEAEADAHRFYTFAKNKINPRAVYTVSFIHDRVKAGEETVCKIDNRIFTGKILHKLDPVNRVFPYIATAGEKLANANLNSFHDIELVAKWSGLVQYMVLSKMREFLIDHIKDAFHTGNLNSINPGSGNAENWPIEQNAEVFKLFNDSIDPGVRLLPSGLMSPPYSVSGFLFESEAFYVNCQYCDRKGCPGRKAPRV
ncbi:MAG: hypothetical protein CSA23_01690 [Deltaproteobacteria bacterium]|nr:MAG: hypothetical protein CSA23_01690 [Deltaproteobacteria bacterium]